MLLHYKAKLIPIECNLLSFGYTLISRIPRTFFHVCILSWQINYIYFISNFILFSCIEISTECYSNSKQNESFPLLHLTKEIKVSFSIRSCLPKKNKNMLQYIQCHAEIVVIFILWIFKYFIMRLLLFP